MWTRDMDCRLFRDQHALLIDQRCSALEENEMREHLHRCAKCARHDTSVRRSLLLVRNTPDIALSPDFQARLEARLRAGAQPVDLRRPMLTSGAFVAIAATLVFATVLAASAFRGAASPEIRMQPVVASAPEAEPAFASSALVATIATGMSVWPAIMSASQAPIHFVAAEMASER